MDDAHRQRHAVPLAASQRAAPWHGRTGSRRSWRADLHRRVHQRTRRPSLQLEVAVVEADVGASKPPWCMVHFAPMRLGIWPHRRAPWCGRPARQARRSPGCRPVPVAGDGPPCCSETSARMSADPRRAWRAAPLPRGAVHQARRSGIRPALNMPWRASFTSSAMSMPIGQASVQRPHIVHES